MNKKLLGAGALAGAAALFIGGSLGPVRLEPSQARPPTTPVKVEDAVAPLTSGAAGAVSALVDSLEAEPNSAALHAELGLAYLREARETADPSRLPLAQESLGRSLELQPKENLEAFVGMAALSNARHQFSQSVSWARRAIAISPFNSAAYGLLGDALFELGRVPAADAAYEEMVERRPDVASYVRASYALQFHGRTRAALGVMRLALQAAGPTGEIAAWVRHQMGDIYAGSGDTREAARQNRIGISVAPGFVPPTVGLAEAHIARGRLEAAIDIMETAANELPSLEYMITLGDLYKVTDHAELATAQYADVAEKLADYRDNGVLPDADFIIFYADHRLRPEAALREAVTLYTDRPTPKIADALGWMLHSVGRNSEAWRYARKAIRSKEADSPMLFHAGMIARSLGESGTASRLLNRALTLDPGFSVVDAPIARRLVSR